MKNIKKNSLLNNFKSGVNNVSLMFSSIPNNFEPFRKDLWTLEFPVQMNIPTQFQVAAARPKVTNTIQKVQYKNLETKYKGKTTVGDITVEFRDAIGSSIYAKLWQWQREHTDFSNGRGGYAAAYKKDLTLYLEDPAGGPMQKWIWYGCILMDLDGGELTMTDDSIASVKMTIAMDACELIY
jgi:hypothetical protein